MKHKNSIWLILTGLFFVLNPAKSQFIGSETDSALPPVDVRKGSVVEYSLQADAHPGEQFRWEVTGGKIINAGATGEGTIASPSVLEFTVDMHTIDIQWQPDDSTPAPTTGLLQVQKKTVNLCASAIMKQSINQWSMPTASFDTNSTDFTICSGDLVGSYIVVNLTGATGYTFRYSIKSNGLKDETGAINTEFQTINTLNDSVHISLPALLINPSEAACKYYTVELLSMNDTFLGNGEIIETRKAFIITVYPSAKVGTIESTKLNKR